MQVKALSSSKERIRKILSSKPTDRIGIFDLDVELYKEESDKESNKFFAFTFEGPFQSMVSEYGLEESLAEFIQEPRHSLSFFKERLKYIALKYKALKDDGYRFDGAWMWEDIAYEKGLYFSIEKYRDKLLGPHREICDFFKSEGLSVLFHCDGSVENLIPLLANTGVKALHPMQERCNPHLLRIKHAFKGVITFIGGVGIHRLGQERKELFDYIRSLKEEGGYIFSFDSPVPEDFDKNEYDKLLTAISCKL